MSGRGSTAEVMQLIRAAQIRGAQSARGVRRAAALGLGAASLNALLATVGRVGVRRRPVSRTSSWPTSRSSACRRASRSASTPASPTAARVWRCSRTCSRGWSASTSAAASWRCSRPRRWSRNADVTQFTFTLRDGLTWSDGTPLNAHDYEYSWKRVLAAGDQVRIHHRDVPGRRRPGVHRGHRHDRRRRRQGRRRQDAGRRLWPGRPPISRSWPPPGPSTRCPRHVVEQHGDAWVEAGNMVSNGPYILTEWDHDQTMVLEQNPNYAGDQADHHPRRLHPPRRPGRPGPRPLRERRARPGPGQRRRPRPRQGRRDAEQPDAGLPPLRHPLHHPATRPTRRPTTCWSARRCRWRSTGRRWPTRSSRASSPRPRSCCRPTSPATTPAAALGEDVAQAKALLAEAGFADGAGFPELTLTYIAPGHDREELLRVPARGLEAEPRHRRHPRPAGGQGVPGLVQLAARPTRSTCFINLWGSDWGDPANWHNQLFESAADFYHAHWKNDEFDTLVNDARGLPDAAERLASTSRPKAILVQDAAIIPLHNLNRIYVIKPYVKGIVHYPILGRTWLKYIQIEKH